MEYRGLVKITSGGQTGADQGALYACRDKRFQSGGWAPVGWQTSSGPAPILQEFGLQQLPGGDYSFRTKKNVEEADGVLIIASNLTSPGTKLTIQHAEKLYKPVLKLKFSGDNQHTAEDLADFVVEEGVRVLLVAGNRDLWDSRHFHVAYAAVTGLIDAIRLRT